MTTRTRCQGAIVRGSQVLLIQHREHAGGRSYWLLPGGGQEDGESADECVIREMREETGLEVEIVCLLFDDQFLEKKAEVNKQFLTYLCRIVSGEPKPGYEPEVEASEIYGITDVSWFDLRDETSWGENILNDRITYPMMKRLQERLVSS
jgi:ADP-ribose pyrophosphatase YjhB (NUDIX family)